MRLSRTLAALVFVGGMLGTLARYQVAQALPAQAGRWPVATLLVNLSGAAALGFVLGALRQRGPDAGRLLAARMLVGAGFLGAYTTYSALAVELDLLITATGIAPALGYAAASLAGGLLAGLAGLWLGDRTGNRALRRRFPEDPDALDAAPEGAEAGRRG